MSARIVPMGRVFGDVPRSFPMGAVCVQADLSTWQNAALLPKPRHDGLLLERSRQGRGHGWLTGERQYPVSGRGAQATVSQLGGNIRKNCPGVGTEMIPCRHGANCLTGKIPTDAEGVNSTGYRWGGGVFDNSGAAEAMTCFLPRCAALRDASRLRYRVGERESLNSFEA